VKKIELFDSSPIIDPHRHYKCWNRNFYKKIERKKEKREKKEERNEKRRESVERKE
jgi:hypothetical protein